MKKLSQYDYSLYIVTDKKIACRHSMTQIIKSAIAGGATIVQYREKTTNTKEMVKQARLLHKITIKTKTPLIINDRIDIALAIGAEGVHVGQDDISTLLARKIIGPKMILGVSANTVKQAIQAEKDGADYIGAGPVFKTPTKPDANTAIGLKGLINIKKAVSIPVVAIGGINEINAKNIIKIVDGIAVVSAIMGAKNPEKTAKKLFAIIRENKRKGKTL